MDTEKGFIPPYNIPWSTFMTTVEKIAADLPNKIDRSYLGSMSGGLKSYLIAAFKGFGLIHEDLTVSDELKALATKPDERPAMVGALLQNFYPKAYELGSTNATPGELDAAFAEMFPSIASESRTKAMRFYLSAVDFAGAPRSPLWKTPKAGNSGPRKPRAKREKPADETPPTDTPPPTTQNLRQFALPSGAVLSLSSSVNVMLLDRTERKFVMEIIDQIEEHAEKNSVPAAPDEPAEEIASEEEQVSTS
jgi:hypothetical protein